MVDNANYHCFMCDLVYYSKEKVWLPRETYEELELPLPSSGVYHSTCALDYLETYLQPIDEKNKAEVMEGLDQRIKQMQDEKEKTTV